MKHVLLRSMYHGPFKPDPGPSSLTVVANIQPSSFKIFSDPVHGFVSVPKGLIMELVQSPEIQRLRRIRQLGVGNLVFPGAEHSRFAHALGAMALMQDALQHLSEKGVLIARHEYEAALIAALLHDVGHGPFSHTLEHQLISEFRHEDMSRAIIVDLNLRFNGALETALAIFDNTYPRPFFYQLVSSQLDMDRLDYLRRDAFYTGVSEGVVGVDRIIKTLHVMPTEGGPESRIVVEAKGRYAVENFILSRRLMYWQVYLHKTVLAGDHILRSAFLRARQHLEAGTRLPGSEALLFFLRNNLKGTDIHDPEVRRHFTLLDDADVLYTLKTWISLPDPVLSDLARRFIDRQFFRVSFLPEQPTEENHHTWQSQVEHWLLETGRANRTDLPSITPLYFQLTQTHHDAYQKATNTILILDRDGSLCELSEIEDSPIIAALSESVMKRYVCYPKEIPLSLPTSSN